MKSSIFKLVSLLECHHHGKGLTNRNESYHQPRLQTVIDLLSANKLREDYIKSKSGVFEINDISHLNFLRCFRLLCPALKLSIVVVQEPTTFNFQKSIFINVVFHNIFNVLILCLLVVNMESLTNLLYFIYC